MVDKYVFKRPTKEYIGSKLNPTSEYIKQASIYVSKLHNIEIEKATKLVIKCIKDNNPVNPIVKYNSKQPNGDMEVTTTPLTDYIKTTQENGEVLVPSFTSYVHPSKKKSHHSEFVSINVKARKADKKMLFYYLQNNDSNKADYYDTMQASRKINNNSLSGAYCSKGTILYNPSAHNTLTSITRSITSIGNAVTESIIAGNKLFLSPDDVLNYITSILTNYDKNLVSDVIEKYKIVPPTVDEVMDNIIICSEYYWNVPHKLDIIRNYLNKLNDIELSAVLYTNDLYSLRNKNARMIKDLINKLSTVKTNLSTDNLKDIDNAQEGVVNHIHNLCADDIRGMSVNYKELEKTDLLDKLASTTKHVSETLTEYKDFINAFLVTDIAPINIAYIKTMLRKAIVLSDTDSTCASYGEWVKWMEPEIKGVTSRSIAISSSLMTIATQVLDHYIKILSGNMNIDINNFELLKMKNEFFWNSFITTNAGKHYFADIAIKEGNVFAKTKPEIKGVNLLASKINALYREYGNDMMEHIKKQSLLGEKIDLFKMVKDVADLERSIISKIKNADTTVLSTDKIKDPASYSTSPADSPYQHYTLWNDVFGKKYGRSPEPSYSVVKVPTILKSANKVMAYINTIEDKEIASNLTNYIIKYKKKSIGTFRPPVEITTNKGLPKEILDCIDYRRVVFDNCLGMYYVLETLGFYKPPKHMICELGPY